MPYISHRSLILTERAVVRKGADLFIHTCGDGPELTKHLVSFTDKKSAIAVGRLLLRDLRSCRTDSQYNSTVRSFMEAVIRARNPELFQATETTDNTKEGNPHARPDETLRPPGDEQT